MNDSISAAHQRSIEQPESFWAGEAADIAWFKPPQQILTHDQQGTARWFADGELNLSHCALDAQIEQGRGDQIALVYDSPVTATQRRYSYAQLRDEVAKLAGALRALGVGRGDRVILYMPMVPEAAMGMLACARLGAIHSVVFGGFAAHELAMRIDDAQPKVVLAASCGIEVSKVLPYKPLLDEALALAEHPPQHCLLLQRPQLRCELQAPRDLDWAATVAAAEPAAPVWVRATDPLYVLYTSGTTGKPKGVVRDNGGYAVAMRYSMKALYDLHPGDVMFTASDVGWVVGHSYIVYAPLLTGCTTILYEGKPVRTPDAGAFWRVVQAHRVNVLFAAPTAFRAIRKEDPEGRRIADYDLSSLKALFLAGERLDPATYHWLGQRFPQLPVVDHWWQTETGWAIAGNPLGLGPMAPAKPGSASFPMPGFDVQILDEHGDPLPRGQQGAVVIRLPLPPGCLTTIWNNHARFEAGYLADFPGYYLTGDGGYIDEDGYLFIMGRTDDVMNIAGHRLSSGEMEAVIGTHEQVAECAVVGVDDDLKGQVPLGLVVTRDGWNGDAAALEQELAALVRHEVGAIACYKRTLVVPRLPKTRSGKILRKTLRAMAGGEPVAMPSTIEDPAAIDEVRVVLGRDLRV